jgi:uncharacterized protein YdeI (YjbR/CyaY-like superfamily)
MKERKFEMGTRDHRTDAYIARSPEFAHAILEHMRNLVHTHCPEAVETNKWGMPHFEYKGQIFCAYAAFKQHCSFGFWLGDLMTLEAKPTGGMGQFGRITSVADLPKEKEFIKHIKHAMKLHDAGMKAPSRLKQNPKEKEELPVPPLFLSALSKNQQALATFQAFSPSKRKEYVTWYTEAKTDVTREKRLSQAIEWMAEGKSRNWKYENC